MTRHSRVTAGVREKTPSNLRGLEKKRNAHRDSELSVHPNNGRSDHGDRAESLDAERFRVSPHCRANCMT